MCLKTRRSDMILIIKTCLVLSRFIMSPPEQPSLTDYEAGRLEGHGNDYQRLVAWVLLLKLTLAKRIFKLGFEMKRANKFDDIVLCLDGEWYLIQTKHSLPTKEKDTNVTKEDLMIKTDKELSLAKYIVGYYEMCNGQNKWNYGAIKQLILMTNRNVDEATFEANDYRQIEPNELLKFSCGKQLQLVDQEEEIMKALYKQLFCRDYKKISKAVEKLFKKGTMSDIIEEYHILLKEILTVKNHAVHLVEPTSAEISELSKLYLELKNTYEDNKNKPVQASVMNSFWQKPINLIETKIERRTIEEFFSKLVISILQPNVEQLKKEIMQISRIWMRSWIRPDDLGRLDESFFELPLNTIRKEFEEYEKLSSTKYSVGTNDRKYFLQNHDGEQLLRKITGKLENEIKKTSKRSCASLQAIEYFYVNRFIFCLDSEDNISETNFIENVSTGEPKYYVITAPPGMGKSTLMQYLAFGVQRSDSLKSVFLIYLNNLQEDLPDINKIEDIVEYKIFQLDLSNESVDLIVNDYTADIILFFDAFDELTETNQNKFRNLIDVLLAKDNIKIIVSGRTHVREKLVEQREAISMNVRALSRKDQLGFFERFWKNVSENPIKFNEFSSKLMDKFKNDVSSREQDLLGVPLMTRMVAEIYAGSFEQYLNSDDDLDQLIPDGKFTIDSLYEMFVETCNIITMNKKYNVNNSMKPDRFFDPMLKAIDYDYQVFAVEHILSWELNIFVTDKRYHKTLRAFEAKIGNEQSLLVETVAKVSRFVHLSFGEYYAAKYLFELSGSMDNCQYYDQILEDLRQHENVKNFILAMMNSHILLSTESTKICFNKLTKSNKNRLRLLKQLGEDVIFASCKMDYSNIVGFLHYLHEPFTFENIRDANGISVLELAHTSGAQKVEQFLVDILMQGTFFQHPLHFAVDSDHFKLVKQFPSLEENVNATDENGNTPLFMAKSVDILECLIKNKANVTIENRSGETALHFASKKGLLQIVTLLIGNGAKVDIKSNDDKTPLDLAVENFHPNIVRFLLNVTKVEINKETLATNVPTRLKSLIHDKEYDEDIDDNGWLGIDKCVNNKQKIKNVIEAYRLIGTDVNSKDDKGNTALHFAAKYDCIEAVQILINRKADLNAKNAKGLTPLHIAVLANSFEVLKLLTAQEIDFSLTNTNDYTAVHFAARSEKCLPLLIEKLRLYPAILDTQNSSKQTALNIAIQYEREGNIRLLLDAGASVDIALEYERAIDFFINSSDNFKSYFFRIEKSTNQMGVILLNAAYLGCQEVVQQLLDSNCDINSKDKVKETALHLAVKHGHYNVVKLLVDRKADLNSVDVTGQTPLHKAVEKNDFKVVKLLVENKVNVNIPDNSGETALHIAASKNNSSILNILLEHKALPNCQDENGQTPLHFCSKVFFFNRLVSAGADQKLKDKRDNTGLHIAAMRNYGELAQRIIEINLLDIDGINKNGFTALHLASMRGHEKIVQLLIDYKAKVFVEDNKGETPLYKAITGCQVEVVRCILKNSTNDDLFNYKYLLHEAISSEGKIIDLLLEAGFDINAIDDFGRTPLHIAAKSHNSVNFEILIDNEADVDALDDEGNSPLHHAVECWAANRKVSYLVDFTTNTNIRNKNEETPLHRSIIYFDKKNPRILIAKNACIHVADKHGNTPLHLAIIHGRIELVNQLAGIAPEFDRQNKNGETALHLAVLKSNFPIVQILTEKGTDLRLKTTEGKTALDLAQEKQFVEIYEYLKYKIDSEVK